MCPWSGSTLIRCPLDVKMSVWWTSFLSIMVFVTLWRWLPLDQSELFCTHFNSKHYPPFLKVQSWWSTFSDVWLWLWPCPTRTSTYAIVVLRSTNTWLLATASIRSCSSCTTTWSFDTGILSLICCFMNSYVKHISTGWRVCSAAWGNTIGSAWDSSSCACA